MTAPVLGKLDWQPAADVPELLAAPVRDALGGLPAYAAGIDPGLADTAAFCAEYDVPMAASANCVVVLGKRAGEESYAAVLVLATDRADVNGVIRKHLGVRKISFAAQDDAVGTTGMEYGGITPIGLPADWPVLVDAAVAAAPEVVIGGGVRGSKLFLPGRALLALTGAELVEDLARPVG